MHCSRPLLLEALSPCITHCDNFPASTLHAFSCYQHTKPSHRLHCKAEGTEGLQRSLTPGLCVQAQICQNFFLVLQHPNGCRNSIQELSYAKCTCVSGALHALSFGWYFPTNCSLLLFCFGQAGPKTKRLATLQPVLANQLIGFCGGQW